MLEYARIMDDRHAATTGDLIDAYTREHLPMLKLTTQRDYAPMLASLRKSFGHMPPESITPRDIYQYRSHFRGPRGNRHVAVLSGVLSLGVQKGLIDRNPCHEVKRLKEHPRDRYVTDAEFQAVRNVAGRPLQSAMDLALLTGLRRGDLISLPLSAIQEDGLDVGTSKTGRRLIILWTPRLRAAVSAAQDYNPGKIRAMRVLVNTHGRPWTGGGFDAAWQRLQRKCIDKKVLKEKFQFRDIRSKATEHAPDATELLGHTSPAVTNRHYLRHPKRVAPSAGILEKSDFIGNSGEGGDA